MAYKRPGVYVEETLLQSSPDFYPSVTVAAFVGVAERGPIEPHFIESWSAFQRIYGGFAGTNQALAHAVFQYFNNGGRSAYIVRAVGTGAVAATRTLEDQGAGEDAADLFKIDAASPGAWGNAVYVTVTENGAGDRFNLDVYVGGNERSNLVERWTDLILDPQDGRYAPNLINSNGGSSYIRVTDLFNHAGSTPFDPEVHLPAVGALYVLSGGVQGAAPTGGASGQTVAAVEKLAAIPDFLTLNVPEVTDSAVINAIIAWAEGRGNVFVVIDCGVNKAVTGVGSIVSDVAAYTASSYAAVYYPRLIVADPSNATPGSVRTVAPGGAVVGQYALTDATRGVHKTPAGTGARLSGVVALERKALDSELDELNVANINAIRSVPGAGFCIMGGRTLKGAQVDKYISARRTLISLRLALTQATRLAIFEPNDEELWDMLEVACTRVLMDLWQDGGLRGLVSEDAFYVKCDAENNPQSSINNGEVHVEVGVALESPAEFIVLHIGQYESGTAITEEA